MIATETDSVSWLRVILAFSFILALLAGLMLALKYAAGRGLHLPGMPMPNARLKVVESLPIDIRRRLVIARCDDKEYLLLLGPERDSVVADLGKNQTQQEITN